MKSKTPGRPVEFITGAPKPNIGRESLLANSSIDCALTEMWPGPNVKLSSGPGTAFSFAPVAATFNRPGHEIIDHHTYVFMGDGCMMEGISHEAASLAGMQKLGKLIAVYDNNGISIDGKVVGWFDDNTAERFEAYGSEGTAVLEGDRIAKTHQQPLLVALQDRAVEPANCLFARLLDEATLSAQDEPGE